MNRHSISVICMKGDSKGPTKRVYENDRTGLLSASFSRPKPIFFQLFCQLAHSTSHNFNFVNWPTDINKSLQGQLVRSIVFYNKHHQRLHRSKQTMVKESARLRALARNASPPRRVLRSSSQPPSKAIQKKGIAKRVSLLTPVCSKSH